VSSLADEVGGWLKRTAEDHHPGWHSSGATALHLPVAKLRHAWCADQTGDWLASGVSAPGCGNRNATSTLLASGAAIVHHDQGFPLAIWTIHVSVSARLRTYSLCEKRPDHSIRRFCTARCYPVLFWAGGRGSRVGTCTAVCMHPYIHTPFGSPGTRASATLCAIKPLCAFRVAWPQFRPISASTPLQRRSVVLRIGVRAESS